MIRLISNVGARFKSGQEVADDAISPALLERLLADGGAERIENPVDASAAPAAPPRRRRGRGQ